MKRIACLMLFCVLGLAALPALAGQTVNSRSGDTTWEIFDANGGQLILTLYWKTRSANLFLIGDCDDGAAFVSGSLEDRFQRLEIGIDPGTTCFVDVVDRGRGSKYWMNIQGTGEFRRSAPQVRKIRRQPAGERGPAAEESEGGVRRKAN